MLVRSALGAVAGLGLVVGGVASPAAAHGDHGDHGDSDTLRVTVCKKVEENNDHDRRLKGRDKDEEEFDFRAKTDEDREKFSLEDGDCEKLKLEFDNNKFVLREHVEDGWDDPEFKVYGDDERSWDDEGKLVVKFDDDEDNPRLWIVVVNSEEDDDED
jgi:hypothetical protein